MKFSSICVLVLSFVFAACSSNTSEHSATISNKDSLLADSLYGINKDSNEIKASIDTLLPFFTKLHDSIPDAKRFDTTYRYAIELHKKEREVKTLYYGKGTDGQYYFMITRLEPSIKRDKYLAICGRFKRNASGNIDTSSYEELFWTWKMRKAQLYPRAARLFLDAAAGLDLKKYYPQYSKDEYIMFPDERVSYNQKAKQWNTVLELPAK